MFNWKYACILMFDMMCNKASKISIYTSVVFCYLTLECRDSSLHIATLQMKVKNVGIIIVNFQLVNFQLC